jgi:predicted hydrocarbon binding protein/KaiC/GvpD/RAD55 family RecA-like ATPase
MLLTALQEALLKNFILLIGSPGSGKSTFCHQTVLRTIDYRPVIYLTTESAPSEIAGLLKQEGLGDLSLNPLYFIDAFHETVGLKGEIGPNTVSASSEDLTGLSIAISMLRKRIKQNSLLIVDSLTSPYLFTGPQIFRFISKTLYRLAGQGNAVLACIDDGCGKKEDLVAMMSIVDGIIKIELQEGSRIYNVIKHPKVEPTKIKTPMTHDPVIAYHFDNRRRLQHSLTMMGLMHGFPVRKEVGDYLNVFWMNFSRWSGMLWDPKRFPMLTYNASKATIPDTIRKSRKFFPLRARLYLKIFMPSNFSKVKSMKRLSKVVKRSLEGNNSGILEYLENVSKTDEHYLRLYENAVCWGFENVGATLALGVLGSWAGYTTAYEKEDRDWNIVETKCIGIGDPYCEFKICPGEIDELKDSLEAIDNTIVEKIRHRLMDQLMDHMLYGKPLGERPSLGNEISLDAYTNGIVMPAVASERYRNAMRLAGVLGGKEVGKRLMEAGIREDEAVQKIGNLMEHCKVGKLSIGETIRMRDSCESVVIDAEEPSCFFITGFLNGFFSVVKNLHIEEKKCIAVGDPYCEWEFI